MANVKLAFLKWRGKREYLKLRAMEEQLDADCGRTLLDFICPEVAKQRQKVQQLYDRCMELEEAKQ